MVPNISIPEVNLDIPKDKIDIKIHGNFVVGIINALKGFIINTMTGKITKMVQSKIEGEIPEKINEAIYNTSGAAEIFNGTMLDWTAPNYPIFSQQKLFVPIKGLFYKKGEEEIEPSIPVPGMVPDPAAKSMLKFAVSAYSIESILKVNEGFSGWTAH